MEEGHRKTRELFKDDLSLSLTEEERKQMLENIHRSLVWIGVAIPDRLKDGREAIRMEMEKESLASGSLPPEVHPEKGDIDLRHLIERLISEKELTGDERTQVRELIDILGSMELQDEEKLKGSSMTRLQARELYDETAGVIRALIELKDLLKRREHGDGKADEKAEAIRRRVEDARRWNAFMKQIKE